MAPDVVKVNPFEELSTKIYNLIEDVATDKVLVHDKTKALNSLYLLRDSVIDLRYAHSLVEQLGEERVRLMQQQVDKEEFTGELHDKYHEVSGQLRSSLIAIFQQGKRTLNNSSHVLASFLPHGVAIKVGSFGRQFESAQKIDAAKLDTRSAVLINNILQEGPKLEIHNDARDMYIEHATPATSVQQRRPLHTGKGLNFMKEKPEFTGIQERLLTGMVRTAMPDFVLLGTKRPSGGEELRTYYVHVGLQLVPVQKGIVRSSYIMHPPEADPDHFKKIEPHTHAFTVNANEDSDIEATIDHSVEITELAKVEEMVKDYCKYVDNLLDAAKLNSEAT